MRKHPVEDKQFEEEVLSIDRVTRVNSGGRQLRFRAIVVVGDKKGKIGIGTGKSNEVVGAVKKATRNAKKDLIDVILFNDTIPHDISIQYKSSHILLLPAGPGTGVIAGSVIRKILAIAGYKNVLSKCFGSSNKLLNAQATFMALKKLQQVPFKERPKKQEVILAKKEEPMQDNNKFVPRKKQVSQQPYPDKKVSHSTKK